MSERDLFTVAQKPKTSDPKPDQKVGSNVPEMSVADLANSLKRTLEQNFGHIRVRGELSGIKVVGSGHMYGDIKDVDAVINIVCWRGQLSKLAIKPEDGMDVIVTGRVSSYPKSSRYQIIIEKLELAGEGALLKLLEERKKKLAAEGLFDANRKQKLPFIPNVIGVVTSPTGAVIRDIMHRLKDRFPRHVLLWPVSVQGTNSHDQIANAINGFNALDGKGLPKPDLLIVARGGGSLEDLMAFNEENVIRAVANSKIPVISAVGHETDTTLIDYVSDVRAPTPTGAAEIAVPVRLNLAAQVQNDFERLISASTRLIHNKATALEARAGRLSHPKQILENKTQNIDFLSSKLQQSLRNVITRNKSVLSEQAAKIVSPKFLINNKEQELNHKVAILKNLSVRLIKEKKTELMNQQRILDSLSPKGVLSRGYALIYDDNGLIIRNSDSLTHNQKVKIEFDQKDIIDVTVEKP